MLDVRLRKTEALCLRRSIATRLKTWWNLGSEQTDLLGGAEGKKQKDRRSESVTFTRSESTLR